MMDELYNPAKIEKSAQCFWEEHHCFEAREESNKENFYALTMFPYPSGRLHMGHARVFTICDVISRYQRMLGKNVLQPMGWDAFGLPAENAAIQNKIPPAEWTYKNINFMRQQMKRLGLAYDWTREITTCDPNYYRFEQWLFLKLFEKGLVYKKNAEVNWDPVDHTILANEQVIDGRGWRSGALVERREIPQWFFKITAYADQLLDDLAKLEHWPEQVKTMQKNWIGRSHGVEVRFTLANNETHLKIFTTRPDTLFGVTYLAIAPQHPLAKLAAEKNPLIQAFLEECKNIKVAEAEFATIEKRGIPTEYVALHPITKKPLPIWIANFVLMSYGAGAIMAVPAHDERDFEFAKRYDLPIKQVIIPTNQNTWDFSKGAFTEPGELTDSEQFTGLHSTLASSQIAEFLENHGQGQRSIHFRLRDWSISRQRYWGAPIPIINCSECGAVAVPEEDLPVILPEKIEFMGVTSPLKNMATFYETTCPTCKRPAIRETDTFDTFVESSWYYARFTCPDQPQKMLDDRANYWLPVNQYVGGVEHAVMHLLYARFFHKVLRDLGLVNGDEPFTALLTQGHVLKDGTKMSKSKGNVVDPDALIDRLGADTVRLFMMFAAPPSQSLEWSDSGVEGSHRFLKRLWAYAYEQRELIQQQNAKLPTLDFKHLDRAQRTILSELYEILDQVTYDYERLQFNTVVSGCMKLLNLLTKIPNVHNDPVHDFIIYEGMSILLRLLAPIAPHITHALWHDLQYKGELLEAAWPISHRAAVTMDEIELVVQINGKLRTKVTVPTSADTQAIKKIVLDDAKVQQTISNKDIKKFITVPGRLVNIVTD